MKSYKLVSHRPCPDCGGNVWKAYILERQVQPVAGVMLVAAEMFPTVAKIDWEFLVKHDVVNVCDGCGATIL